jgi:hypothetical protein
MGGDLCGGLGDTQEIGDLAIGEIGGDTQTNELALAGPQALECGVDAVEVVPLLDYRLDVCTARGAAAEACQQSPHPTLSAVMIDGEVAGDTDEPGPELGG